MVSVPIRVLIINHQLSFSVRIKQSLEQTGRFEVTSFTSASAAIEHLQERPYQVALVDFDLGQMSGADIVRRLRAIQLDIAVVASPQTESIDAQISPLKLNGIIDVPCTARELIPVLEKAVNQVHESLEDTSESPIQSDTETLAIQQPPDFSSLDSVLFRMGGFTPTVGTETIDVDPDSPEGHSRPIEVILSGKFGALAEEEPDVEDSRATEIFNRLAAEEPPVPDLENNGTISDLITSVGRTNLDEVADVMMHQQDTEETHAATPDDYDDENTARIVVESALDDSAPLELSLAELLNNLEQQFPDNDQGIRPLPSWLNDFRRFVSEPDFLQMSLPDVEEYYDASMDTTLMVKSDEIESAPGDIETEFIEPQTRRPDVPPPPPGLPGMPVEIGIIDESQPVEVDEADLNTDRVETVVADTLPGEAIDAEVDLPGQVGKTEEHDDVLPPYEFDEIVTEEDEEELEAEEAPISRRETTELPPYQFEITDIEDLAEKSDRDKQAVQTHPVAELPPYEFDDPLSEEVSTADKTGTSESERVRPASQISTLGTDSDNPQIANIALTLTQISLELTAEATILIKDHEIVAYAGPMPLEDIEGLRDDLLESWEASPGESRIRFITLPGSGQDYMLFSRRTAGDYVLSMIFAGNMPLRVIRRQSKRLLEAIQAASTMVEAAPALPSGDIEALEAEAIREEQAALESSQQLQAIQEFTQKNAATELDIQVKPDQEKAPVQRTAYTYVWLINDPDQPLTSSVAEALVNTLDDRLEDRGWEVRTLHVFEDYIYLFADVPVDEVDNQSISDLKQLSGEIAHEVDSSLEPDNLWDDSYFVLAPGRELHQDEIQDYISFVRD